MIAARGVICEVCGHSHEGRYGPELAGRAVVQHKNPVSLGETTPEVDDFAILCGSCHDAAHYKRGSNPRSIEELRSVYRKV